MGKNLSSKLTALNTNCRRPAEFPSRKISKSKHAGIRSIVQQLKLVQALGHAGPAQSILEYDGLVVGAELVEDALICAAGKEKIVP